MTSPIVETADTTRFFQGLAGREWKVSAEGSFYRAARDGNWTAVPATAESLERSRGVWEVFP